MARSLVSLPAGRMCLTMASEVPGRLDDPHVALLQAHRLPVPLAPSGVSASSTSVATSPWVQRTADSPAIRSINRNASAPCPSASSSIDSTGEPQGLGRRAHRFAAAHVGTAQNALGSVVAQEWAPAPRACATPPLGERARPVVALVGAPSPGMPVPDQQQRHAHDAPMPGALMDDGRPGHRRRPSTGRGGEALPLDRRHLDPRMKREGEHVEISTAPGQGVIPALGEPPTAAVEDVPVVVEPEDRRPAAALPLLAQLAHEQAADRRPGRGPSGNTMWALRMTNSKNSNCSMERPMNSPRSAAARQHEGFPGPPVDDDRPRRARTAAPARPTPAG